MLLIFIINKMVQKRHTKQKKTIEEAIKNKKGFFSAENLYEDLKQKNIGIATIYRALKEKEESGQIFVYFCNKRKIYSSKKRSHCHFICEETGKTIHFDIDSFDFLKDQIPGNIESIQIEVRGRCPKHS